MANDRIQLTAGLRYQQIKSANFNVVTGTQTSNYDRSAWTPAFAVLVKPAKNLSLYGNYIEGLSQGPIAPSSAVNAGEIFPPFVSKQYEIGAKYDFGRTILSLSAFQIDRPSSFPDPATRRFGVEGNQRNRGIELTATGELVRSVRIIGGLAYTDGELTDTQGGVNDGNTAPAVPEIQVNLNGEWDMPLLPGLTLTARMLYTSSQYVDVANTQKIPGWIRFDIGARYAFNAGDTPITIRGSIENVFGNDYWLSPARGGMTVGAPLTALVSITTDF